MGMTISTSFAGIRPPDAKWEAFKEVWDTCKKAGIEPPAEVSRFFNDEEPVEQGVVAFEASVDPMYGGFNTGRGIPQGLVVEEVDNTDDNSNNYGFVLDLSRVPEDVKWLRITTYVSS